MMGRIVGNWKKDSKKKALTVETSLFDESLDLPEDLLKKAVDYYCSFHAQSRDSTLDCGTFYTLFPNPLHTSPISFVLYVLFYWFVYQWFVLKYIFISISGTSFAIYLSELDIILPEILFSD